MYISTWKLLERFYKLFINVNTFFHHESHVVFVSKQVGFSSLSIGFNVTGQSQLLRAFNVSIIITTCRVICGSVQNFLCGFLFLFFDDVVLTNSSLYLKSQCPYFSLFFRVLFSMHLSIIFLCPLSVFLKVFLNYCTFVNF